MKNNKRQSHMEGLLVLLLFGVFALCILSVLLTGAGAYKRLMERGQSAFDERTVPQYIATKVRQADTKGGILTGTLGGASVLELHENIEDSTYVTRIYCYDGYLRELFSEERIAVTPEDGEAIVEAEKAQFTLEDNRLTVVIESKKGIRTEFTLTLRAEEAKNEK